MMAGAQHSHRVFQSSAFTRSPQWHPWLGMLSNGLPWRQSNFTVGFVEGLGMLAM